MRIKEYQKHKFRDESGIKTSSKMIEEPKGVDSIESQQMKNEEDLEVQSA